MAYEIKSEMDIKEVADRFSDTVAIRGYTANGSSYDYRRQSTKEEKQVLSAVMYGTLLGLNRSLQPDVGEFPPQSVQIAKDIAEFTFNRSFPDSNYNGYLSIYSPLDDIINNWNDWDKIHPRQADDKKTMTFEEYLLKMGAEDKEFEAVIDNSDMPATFCPPGDIYYSAYCHEKYGTLLAAKVAVISPETGTANEVVEVDYGNYNKAKDFCMALAGYVSISEDSKLFPKTAVKNAVELINQEIENRGINDFTAEFYNGSEAYSFVNECVNSDNQLDLDKITETYTEEGMKDHLHTILTQWVGKTYEEANELLDFKSSKTEMFDNGNTAEDKESEIIRIINGKPTKLEGKKYESAKRAFDEYFNDYYVDEDSEEFLDLTQSKNSRS